MPVYLCNMYNFFFIIHVEVGIDRRVPKVGKGKFYLCMYNVVM